MRPERIVAALLAGVAAGLVALLIFGPTEGAKAKGDKPRAATPAPTTTAPTTASSPALTAWQPSARTSIRCRPSSPALAPRGFAFMPG